MFADGAPTSADSGLGLQWSGGFSGASVSSSVVPKGPQLGAFKRTCVRMRTPLNHLLDIKSRGCPTDLGFGVLSFLGFSARHGQVRVCSFVSIIRYKNDYTGSVLFSSMLFSREIR